MKTTNRGFWVSILAFIATAGCAQVAVPQPAPPPSAGPVTPEVQAQSTVSVPGNLSPGVSEVVRLAESGTGDEVILAYIQNSQTPFNLSADHILYLKDVGLSSQVITAMLSRDTALRSALPQNPPPPQAVEAPLTPQQEPPPVYSSPPVEVSYFYNDLAPYGTWVQLEGFGWCWQPRVVVVNRSWRPYCDSGHWLYSDVGWYWYSDYSWGWAPFHYGRWQLHPRCGWVWLPDTVWAPAWVVWRTSGDYCGWAPLPPHAYFDARVGWRFNGVSVRADFDFGLHVDHFTFIAFGDFHNHDLSHRRIATTQVQNVYNRTTIINNYTINNNVVVNRGISVEKVKAATHTEIHKVAIRDEPTTVRSGPKREVATAGGSVIYRPKLPPAASVAPVRVQKVDERHPVIHHAPVTEVTAKHDSRTGSSSTASPAVQPRGQRETTAAPQRPASTRSEPRSSESPATPRTTEPRSTPRPPENRPGPSATQPTTPRREPAATTPSDPRSVPRASESRSAPTRPEEPVRAETSPSRGYPSHGQGQGQPESRQRDYPQQNPHVYYPKSYNQASEIRSVPRSESRQSAPSSRDSDSDSRSKRN